VTDLLGESLRAAGTRSALAYPLVFGAGIVTSAGPCAAPRYVAVAALAHAARAPWRTVAAFTAGLVAAYVALGAAAGAVGTAAGALGALWSASTVIYALLAAVLLAGGIATLLRAGAQSPGDACAHAGTVRDTRDACRARGSASLGGAFLLGASSVVVVSPCCTPVVAAIAGLTLANDRAAEGVGLLAAFAFGHAVPVACIGALGDRFAGALRRLAASQAPAIVSGSLMLALAAYYGALA
jgi:cytochrome c biogenesis protein CcdA